MVAVSVVMTVYNGESHLVAAIDSILAQTFRDFELIVVDDGSTDGTARILAAVRQADQRVRILENARNLGLVASLNRGLAEARGALIARMDADDVSRPHRLARQVEFLRRHPEVDVLGSRLRVLGTWRVWKPPLSHDDIVARLLFESPLYHPTVMLRRHRDDGQGGLGERIVYDERRTHAEDYDLWVRLGLDHGARFANLPEVLLDYRIHRASVSRQFQAAQAQTVTEIRRDQLGKLGIAPSDEEMDLHDRISNLSLGGGADLQARCERWLDKLALNNASADIYPREAFAERLRILKVSARWRRWNLLRKAWRRVW
jgi:glycosyltransferase involved in cell wall biosynthesis